MHSYTGQRYNVMLHFFFFFFCRQRITNVTKQTSKKKNNNPHVVSELFRSVVFYLQVRVNLELIYAPMLTENLQVSADALHFHSIQCGTICLASYRQSIVAWHIDVHSLCTRETQPYTRRFLISIHVLSLNSDIPTIFKFNNTHVWNYMTYKPHNKCHCRSFFSEYVHTTTFTIIQFVRTKKVSAVFFYNKLQLDK